MPAMKPCRLPSSGINKVSVHVRHIKSSNLCSVCVQALIIKMNCSDTDFDEENMCTPPEIAKEAEEVKENLLPAKSKNLYNKTYDEFIKWCSRRNVTSYSENVFLVYFLEKSKICKPSSLWSYYSMLKATMILHENVDISKYSKLIVFLKRKNEGYKPKKSKILSRDQIDVFLNDAPDDTYLMIKVALIFGICGACRREELCNITSDDIQDLDKTLLITIRESKTKIQRVFSIIDNENRSPSFLQIYRKYVSLRPSDTPHRRFFISYKNNKCSKQVVGKNMFGQIPFKIAAYLNLPNPKEYTGHCFRRSSATILADAGADITNIKRHGGWKSTTVAEGYIEDSIANKKEIARKIIGNDLRPSTSPSILFSEKNDPNSNSSKALNENICHRANFCPNIKIENSMNCIVNIKM